MINEFSSIDHTNTLLRDKVVDLVTELTGNPPNKYLSKNGEVRFGRKGGISVMTSGKNKGRITLFDGDGKGRSPIQFIQETFGLNYQGAFFWAKNWLGESSNDSFNVKLTELQKSARENEKLKIRFIEEEERQRKIRGVNNIVEKSIPVTDTNGEAYLRKRAITAKLPDCIRYSNSPSALIFIATTPANKRQAVQRVFLNGVQKANITIQKRTNGILKNSSVRLPGDGNCLYMSEGPETALSVWQATGAPTWAVLGQNFMGHDLPENITTLVIAADNDRIDSPAYKQTERSAQYYFERGYTVLVIRPVGPLKCDFNDVHQELGLEAVRTMLRQARSFDTAKWLYKVPVGTIDDVRQEAATFIDEFCAAAKEYWVNKAMYEASENVDTAI